MQRFSSLVLGILLASAGHVWAQQAGQGRAIATGQNCGGDLGGTFPDCTVPNLGRIGVTASDTSINFLFDKIVVGPGLSKTTLTPGGNEQLQLDIGLLGTAAAGATTSVSGLDKVGTELSLLRCTNAGEVPTMQANGSYQCTTPSGSPSQGPINSVQAADGVGGFAGSSRCVVNPTSGALECSCNRGTPGDCANEMTSESATVAAPAAANRAKVYLKQTGTVYEWCINGNGDTGERCVGVGTPGAVPDKEVDFDMGGCTQAGTSHPNWDYDPAVGVGLAISECAVGGAIGQGVLQFPKPSGGTPTLHCATRRTRLTQNFNAAAPLSAVLKWETVPTTGNAYWSMAALCRTNGTTRASTVWNTATVVIEAAPATTLIQDSVIFNDIDKTGCAGNDDLYVRLCRENANASDTMANDNNATAISLKLQYGRQ